VTTTKQPSIASVIWGFFREQGAKGATADEVLEHYPDWPYQTTTARINGLKNSGLLVRDPSKRIRKTRKGRSAEVWVVPKGAKFDPKRYNEKKPQTVPPPSVTPTATVTAGPCTEPHFSDEEKALLKVCYVYKEHTFKETPDDQKKATNLLFNILDAIEELPKGEAGACGPG
jgi:hypothetical protein